MYVVILKYFQRLCTSYQTPNKSIVLFCLIYLRGLFLFLFSCIYIQRDQFVSEIACVQTSPISFVARATKEIGDVCTQAMSETPHEVKTVHAVSKTLLLLL